MCRALLEPVLIARGWPMSSAREMRGGVGGARRLTAGYMPPLPPLHAQSNDSTCTR